MGLRLEQRFALKQQLNLQQTVNLETLLSMPLRAINSIIDSLALYPAKTNEILKSKKEKYSSSKETRAIFSYLDDSKKSNKENIIIDLQLKDLGSLVKKDAMMQTSLDVEYKSIEKQKPQIKYSLHLAEILDFEMQQIPQQFKEAKSLYDFLVKQRNCMVSELREIYIRLGDEQREFIETLNPVYLRAFPENDLAKKMNLPETTIHGLLKKRYVLIESLEGRKQIHPVNYLMPTPKDIKRYDAIQLKEFLAEESTTRIVYPGDKILNKIRLIREKTLDPRRKIYAKNCLTQFQMPYCQS